MKISHKLRKSLNASRVPRKKKKAVRNALIIYDISGCPKSTTIENVFEIFYRTGILIYNSEVGDRPIVAKPNKHLKLLSI